MKDVQPPNDAQAITASSKSNLALAFVCLDRAKRRDMEVFYAFCRSVDDIADAPDVPKAEKQAELDVWRSALTTPVTEEPELAGDVRALISKYEIDIGLFDEIIQGMEMDLREVTFDDFEQLRNYCYKVASVVGLISIEIFGYKDPACKDYAVNLGLALQITNIIRDVRTDIENENRVYLPLDEMAEFGVTREMLGEPTTHDALARLLEFQAKRAHGFYRAAVDGLLMADRKSMRAAEIMRNVYFELLRLIEKDGFRVLENDYRLSKARKLSLIAQTILGIR